MAEPDYNAEILASLYGLTPEQCVIYSRLSKLVDYAIEQCEHGYAVDVEQEIADLAKGFTP